MDKVFIERLWRSVKYKEIFLHEHATVPVMEAGLVRWFARSTPRRPRQPLGNRTPPGAAKPHPLRPRQPVRRNMERPHELPPQRRVKIC